MRKQAYIIMGVVYFTSILFILFFGFNFSVVNPVVVATDIRFTNQEITQTPDVPERHIWIRTAELNRGINSPQGVFVLQLNWRVMPDNVTNRDVNFFLFADPQLIDRVELDETWGRLIFTGLIPSLNIRVESVDGSMIYDNLLILIM
ncbi:MAG: hypothetical protein FWB72_06410 [Firmicutes bacterium]|nr:hypothetical protein [Bacillota bacterium]